MDNRKANKGSKFTLFLKPIEAIRDVSGHEFQVDKSQKKINIIHSTGNGGGLPLKDWFIERYAGTANPLTVKFIRQTANRFLYETTHPHPPPDIILYGEWLSEHPCQFLDDNLFEI